MSTIHQDIEALESLIVKMTELWIKESTKDTAGRFEHASQRLQDKIERRVEQATARITTLEAELSKHIKCWGDCAKCIPDGCESLRLRKLIGVD